MTTIPQNTQIAVVIPAYKADYLAETLQSLAKQTDQSFTVYIGDDNSPADLLSIIQPFTSKLHIIYNRFEDNLGKNDLVAHWDRCLNLMQDEEFFILFSDDDLMESSCIKNLREAIKEHQEDVFHFDLQIIDGNGKPINQVKPFPSTLSSIDFFELLCTSAIDARMPEFAFRTSHFEQEGGFERFDHAIRSDNATVIKCAFAKGIRTIDDAKVLWRDSGINISSSYGPLSKARYVTFFSTSVAFFNWMENICQQRGVIFPWSITRRFDYLFSSGYNFRHIIGTKTMFTILKKFNHYPKGFLGSTLWVKLFFLKLSRKVKSKLSKPEGIIKSSIFDSV